MCSYYKSFFKAFLAGRRPCSPTAFLRSPARIVRTNKAALGTGLLQATSRIVLPGHMDPDVSEVRTDSPTTQATAVRMAVALCVSPQWLCYLFDISTAFLSGKEVGSELYVRPPRDLKGTTFEELWLILRSAYGLAGAPRLWYERAKELLSECGCEELSFALCTFVWRDPKSKKVLAVLCLHVDDGMLVADSLLQSQGLGCWDNPPKNKRCEEGEGERERESSYRSQPSTFVPIVRSASGSELFCSLGP